MYEEIYTIILITFFTKCIIKLLNELFWILFNYKNLKIIYSLFRFFTLKLILYYRFNVCFFYFYIHFPTILMRNIIFFVYLKKYIFLNKRNNNIK